MGLTNIQDFDDNQCCKWCLKRYLHPADHLLARIGKVDRMFKSELDFKDIKFPFKNRNVHKIEKHKNNNNNNKNKIYISINVFDYKEEYPLCVSKNTFKKHVEQLS